MQIGEYYFSKIQTITLLLLIMGIVIGLALVQTQQIIKTRASVSDSFRVYENDEIQGPRLVAFQGTYPIENFDVTIESTSFENQPSTSIEAKVIPPDPKVSSIAQCWFYRGGDGNGGSPKQIKSQRLLGYMQEAANLTGVPPLVLAAFIRVETGSTLDKVDSTPWENECPKNPSGGDTGVMQIVRPGYNGHDREAVNNGARFIGKTVDTLTMDDYCNPRTNITIGAGFLLKKLSYAKYGNGSSWNPAWTNDQNAIYAMVQGFHGRLLYPTSSGPFNYGNDVWTSIQNCPTGH